MTAVAYVRRSASEESKVSRETQLDTVQRLAGDRGDAIEHVYTDWGRSGGDESRPEYMAMLARAETDGIHAIYAYDQDRLARDIWLFSGLLRVADRRGFSVITPAGDLTDPDQRTFAELRGVLDGGELRKIRKRNLATAKMQRERGDELGMAPYGYEFRTPDKHGTERVEFVCVAPDKIAHVVDAFRRERTYLGTARALNAERWPSKHGGTWHATTVKSVIAREAPELAAPVTRGRRKNHRPRLFAGLMRCYCGGPMSPGTGGGMPGYYCGRGQRGNHPRPYYVSESKLLPWMMDEAEHLLPPAQRLEQDADGYDDSAERVALEGLRGKVADAIVDAGLADLDAKREAEGERRQRYDDIAQRVDWGWPVETINDVLVGMWEYVELGPDLRPVRAEWTVPEWRA